MANSSIEFRPRLEQHKDKAISRLPLEQRESIELLACKVIYESFVTPADEDYLTARVLAMKGLSRNFSWNAGQSLEKYFKAFLLFKGEKVKGGRFSGHPVKTLFETAVSIDPSIHDISTAPNQYIDSSLREMLSLRTVPLLEFIDIVDKIGNPNNRYNAGETVFDVNYVFALDSFIYGFRPRIGVPAIEFSYEWIADDLMSNFFDHNPYFCPEGKNFHSRVSSNFFRLAFQRTIPTQEFLLKNDHLCVNMHTLNWLRQRMII